VVMFCAESSVVVFLFLLCFRLVILLFYVFIVYLYPCAALCAYSINDNDTADIQHSTAVGVFMTHCLQLLPCDSSLTAIRISE